MTFEEQIEWPDKLVWLDIQYTAEGVIISSSARDRNRVCPMDGSAAGAAR